MNRTNTSTDSSSTTVSSSVIEKYLLSGSNSAICIFGIMANLAIIIVICKNPQLRQNCKYLQAALAAGDATICLGQLINQVATFIMTFLPSRLLRWQCLLISTPNVVGIMLSTILTVCVALDRCASILTPIRYWNLNKARCCMVAVTVTSIITGSCTVAMFSDIYLYDYPSGCVGSGARSVRFNSIINYYTVAAGIVIVIVYPITMITMFVKQHRLSKTLSREQRRSNKLTKQIEATTSISYVILAGLVLYILPNMAVLILTAQNVPLGSTRSYVGLTSVIHSSINCIFYIWKEPKMRYFIRIAFFPCAKNTVQPLFTQPGATSVHKPSSRDIQQQI